MSPPSPVHDLIAVDDDRKRPAQKLNHDDMDNGSDSSDAEDCKENNRQDETDTILSSVFVAKESTRAAASSKMLAKLDSDNGSASTTGGRAAQGPSCRDVLFSGSCEYRDNPNASSDSSHTSSSAGEHLFTVCNGGSLRCLDTSRICSLDPTQHDCSILWSVPDAHRVPICKLYQLPTYSPAGSLVVTGDDVGAVRLWDVRICGGDKNNNNSNSRGKAERNNPFDDLMKPPRGCVMQWKVNHDYITDFACNKDGTQLLATSADCTLSVFDVRFIHRKHTPRSVILPEVDFNNPHHQQQRPKQNTWENSGYVQSADQEDELLNLCFIKNYTKVLCTSQQGILSLFSYGIWDDISDRFPGHPQSVDALLKIDEDTVLTGSSDGLVRAVQLLPNALLGVLGSHEGFPVEALGWSAGRKMVGSLSHDEYIRLWDGSFLNDDDDEGDCNSIDEEMDASPVKNECAKASSTKNDDDSDEWEDLDDEDVDNDEEMGDSNGSDSEDSDEGDGKPKKRPNMFKTANEEFFQDL